MVNGWLPKWLANVRAAGGVAGAADAVHGLAADAAPPAVQVVEAVVLLVDDDEVLEVPERAVVCRGRRGRGGQPRPGDCGGRRQQAGSGDCAETSHASASGG